MNLEKQKENFKDHIATFTDYGNIKILDFKRPNSSEYRIRFLFEEDHCRLHISGDLGELIASNYYNMTYEKFSDFVNDVGYFEQKIYCHNRPIYTYDEDLAKEELLKMAKRDDWLLFSDKYEYEIIFVNDGSKDKTLSILKNIADNDKCVKIISFSRNFGHQAAVTAGIKYVTGDAVVIMDADLQDPPELIP